MTKPRIILLNDPTRGIDVGTKQEFYQLLTRLAAERRRHHLLLDRLRRAHRLLRSGSGPLQRQHHPHARRPRAQRAQPDQCRAQPSPRRKHDGHCACATRSRAVSVVGTVAGSRPANKPASSGRTWETVRYWLTAQRGIGLAVLLFVIMFGLYGLKQEVGLSPGIVNTAANKGALLALVAMAQTIPGPHRRARSLGRDDLPDDQLPRLGHRPRRSDPDDAGRHRRSPRRHRVRRPQWSHRGLRPAPADRRYPGDELGLLRHLADPAPRTGRHRQLRPRDLHDLVDLQRSGLGAAAAGRRSLRLDPVSALRPRPGRVRSRFIRTGRLHVRRADRPGKTPRLHPLRISCLDCGADADLPHLLRRWPRR